MSAPFEMVIVKEEPCEYSDVPELPDNPLPVPEEESPKPSTEDNCQTWFACVLCDLTFLEAQQVIQHAQVAHLQDYVCHKCKNKFKNKSTLFSHQIQEDCKEKPYYYLVVRDNVKGENSCTDLAENEHIQENELASSRNFPTRAESTFEIEAPATLHVTLNEQQSNVLSSTAVNHHENIAYLRKTFNASFAAKNLVVVPCIYCPTCDKDFDVNFYMDSHLETENAIACRCPFCRCTISRCSFCTVSVGGYTCKIQFTKHIAEHFKDKNSNLMFHCKTEDCNYTFFNQTNLTHHRKVCGVSVSDCKIPEHSSELMLKKGWMSALESIVKSLKYNSIQDNKNVIPCIYCEGCNLDFNIDTYMLKHVVQNVANKMTCSCFMCGELFLDSMQKYIHHLQTHITGKMKMNMFSCSRAQCNAAFFTAENRNQHYKAIHMKTISEIENPSSGLLYDPLDSLSSMKKCTYDYLERHRSIVYQKSKLYSMMIHCRVCCNAFPFQTYIFKHIDSCSSISCPFCSDRHSFSTSKWFSHFWAHHSCFTNRSAFCHECNYAFYNSYNLAAHVKEEHALIKENDLRDTGGDYVFPIQKKSKKIKYDAAFPMDQPSSSGFR